jgi:hypothetical protein
MLGEYYGIKDESEYNGFKDPYFAAMMLMLTYGLITAC